MLETEELEELAATILENPEMFEMALKAAAADLYRVENSPTNYERRGELRQKVADVEAKIERIKEMYKPQ